MAQLIIALRISLIGVIIMALMWLMVFLGFQILDDFWKR